MARANRKSRNTWKLQDAKARFSELVEKTFSRGPQTVTRRGVDTVVVVPIEEWKRLSLGDRPSLKDLLLGDGPRFENLVPKRRKWKTRPPVRFD